MATTTPMPTEGSTMESAIESIIDPAVLEPEVTEEETPEETTEDDQETESEETEAPQETEEEPESEEVEDESEPEESEEDSEDEAAELYTIAVDGEEVQVDLDELKRGYSGQQYVQKGMQAAAQARKEAETVYQTLQNERRRIGELLAYVEAGNMPTPPVEPDKALFESDPIRYMEEKIKYDEGMAQFTEKVQAFRDISERQTQADEQALQAYLSGEVEQLKAIEPEFREPEKATAARERMIKTGEEVYGFTPEEIGLLSDHRHVRVLMDAVRYHELKQGTAKNVEKSKKRVAKTKRRKAQPSQSTRRRKQRERLKQSGSIDDAVSLLFE